MQDLALLKKAEGRLELLTTENKELDKMVKYSDAIYLHGSIRESNNTTIVRVAIVQEFIDAINAQLERNDLEIQNLKEGLEVVSTAIEKCEGFNGVRSKRRN